jgi:hypothetical protein
MLNSLPGAPAPSDAEAQNENITCKNEACRLRHRCRCVFEKYGGRPRAEPGTRRLRVRLFASCQRHLTVNDQFGETIQINRLQPNCNWQARPD